MKLKQSFKMAFSAVLANKMRSFLTMLGIIIGVMSVTLLISIVQGGTSSITDSLEELGGNQIMVTVTDTHKKLTNTELNSLKGKGGIANVSPSLSGKGTAKAGGTSDDISIYGITESYRDVQGLDIAAGRNVTEFDQQEHLKVCIVGTGTAEKLFGTTSVLNENIRVNGQDYRIVGVLEEEDSSMMGSSTHAVYIPLTDAQRMLKQTAITSFYVTAEDETMLTQAQDTISEYLKRKFGNEDSYTVLNMSNVVDMIDTVLNTLSLMLGRIAAISLSVGGLALGFSVMVGLIFGIYPANKAARLKPINALRFE